MIMNGTKNKLTDKDLKDLDRIIEKCSLIQLPLIMEYFTGEMYNRLKEKKRRKSGRSKKHYK